MDPVLLLIGLVVVLVAGMVQGMTGFGSALVMVPVLSVFLLPREVVPITLVLGTVMNSVILIQARRSLDVKMVLPLFIAASAGIPLGTLVLLVLPAHALRVLIGAVIVLFSVTLLSGASVRCKRERLASIPIGFISGILNGSITMSGPPVILFFQNQGMARDRFRANLVAFFLATNIVTIISFLVGGVLTPRSALPSLYFLPALAIGLFVGISASGKVPEGPFRRIALVIVALAGISSIVTGILGF